MIKENPFIVATLLARDEEDIVEQNIKHHINEGIKHFIVTNHNSKDNTRKLLESFNEIKIIIDNYEISFDQSKYVTKMANYAATLNPKWLIHLDADEFWCGLNYLKQYSFDDILLIPILNHLPLKNEFNFDSMKYYIPKEKNKIVGLPATMAKIAHQPNTNYIIGHGNHKIISNEKINYIEAENIFIHHYPIRSYNQFLKKVTQGVESLSHLNNHENIAIHWKKWHESYLNGTLKNTYDLIIEKSNKLISNEEIKKWIPATKL